MGAADADADERPVHRVTLSEFFIGRFPVTQDDYARFVRASGHPPPSIHNLPLITQGGRDALFRELAMPYVWDHGEPPPGHGSHPVVLVRHDDAVAYCAWLGEALGRVVRLPTEAEWEKAARGGAEGLRYPWGNEIDPSLANYLADPASKRERGTRPTGTYPPNAYGLYDVTGNVWEWVSDWYDSRAYSAEGTRNPAGPASGHLRLLRGGSWLVADVRMLSCSHRHKVPPDTYSYAIGFRVACSA